MVRPWQSSKTGVGTPALNIPTTTETVLATVAGVSTQTADAVLTLEAVAQISTGTGTTSGTLRVRRGVDATGALVGVAQAETVTAGNTIDMELQVVDTPGEVAGQSYVVTYQATGASANSTSQQATLQVTY